MLFRFQNPFQTSAVSARANNFKKLNGRPVRQQIAGGTTWVAPHHHHYHCHRALKEGQHLQTHPFQSKISIILKPKSGKKPTQILKKMTSNTLKADRAIHRVAFNPNRASSAEVLTEMSLCQDLFHLFLTRQLVLTQTVISWTMFQELLLTNWLWNSPK